MQIPAQKVFPENDAQRFESQIASVERMVPVNGPCHAFFHTISNPPQSWFMKLSTFKFRND